MNYVNHHLTAAQLAERWGVSAGHLANLRLYGKGPAYLKLGSAVRYTVAAIEEYEAASLIAPVKAAA